MSVTYKTFAGASYTIDREVALPKNKNKKIKNLDPEMVVGVKCYEQKQPVTHKFQGTDRHSEK